MSFLRSPKPAPATAASAVPDPADLTAAPASARRKRLESGGRNATFLSQTAAAVAADRSPNTLTGLNG